MQFKKPFGALAVCVALASLAACGPTDSSSTPTQSVTAPATKKSSGSTASGVTASPRATSLTTNLCEVVTANDVERALGLKSGTLTATNGAPKNLTPSGTGLCVYNDGSASSVDEVRISRIGTGGWDYWGYTLTSKKATLKRLPDFKGGEAINQGTGELDARSGKDAKFVVAVANLGRTYTDEQLARLLQAAYSSGFGRLGG